MKEITMVTFIFSICAITMCASASKKITNLVGNIMYEMVASPDSVEIFKIKSQRSKDINNLNGFPIIKEGGEITSVEAKLLKSIILNDKTYDFEYTKRCPFLPEYGFQFKKGKKKLNILVCYSCEKLTITYRRKKIIKDYVNVQPKFKKITEKYFQ